MYVSRFGLSSSHIHNEVFLIEMLFFLFIIKENIFREQMILKNKKGQVMRI